MRAFCSCPISTNNNLDDFFNKFLNLWGLFSHLYNQVVEVCDLSVWARSKMLGFSDVLLKPQNTVSINVCPSHMLFSPSFAIIAQEEPKYFAERWY